MTEATISSQQSNQNAKPVSSRIDTGAKDQSESTAVRLYDLLDTLVAMRIDFGNNAEGKAAALTLGPEKISGIRALLDIAIASTKDIIGNLERPTPPA